MPRAEQRFVGPSYKRSRGGSSHRAWRVPQGHSPPGRRARPNAAFPGPRRRGGPETDETLHLRLLRAVYRADVEVQAVLGRLAFRYSHEDERRDTWSPSHLLHQIGRFMLPRRDLDPLVVGVHHLIAEDGRPERRLRRGVVAIDNDLSEPASHGAPTSGSCSSSVIGDHSFPPRWASGNPGGTARQHEGTIRSRAATTKHPGPTAQPSPITSTLARASYTPSYRSPCVPSAWATATQVRAWAAFTSARRRCFSISTFERPSKVSISS